MSEKLEMMKCHHCGHEWEPRVKKPKKCPQCQNPLWVSPRPKKLKVPKAPVDMLAAQTPTAVSEALAPIPPTTDTNSEATPSAVSGVDAPPPEPGPPVLHLQREDAPVEKLEPIYTRVEVAEPETTVQRLQREADERMKRLVNQPID